MQGARLKSAQANALRFPVCHQCSLDTVPSPFSDTQLDIARDQIIPQALMTARDLLPLSTPANPQSAPAEGGGVCELNRCVPVPQTVLGVCTVLLSSSYTVPAALQPPTPSSTRPHPSNVSAAAGSGASSLISASSLPLGLHPVSSKVRVCPALPSAWVGADCLTQCMEACSALHCVLPDGQAGPAQQLGRWSCQRASEEAG